MTIFRNDVKQSNIICKVKQPVRRSNTITDSTVSKLYEEPEYEIVEPNSNIRLGSNVKKDRLDSNVRMDANPAYQVTS